MVSQDHGNHSFKAFVLEESSPNSVDYGRIVHKRKPELKAKKGRWVRMTIKP